MTTQELNIANALFTAREILTKMIGQGLADEKYIFAVSKALCENYNLTTKQSIIILEQAVKIA